MFSVSQLLEVNDLTGRLTVDENVVLLTGLANFPHLQYKLRLLIRSMRRAPVVDKFVTPITTATSLFLLDKNLSQIFKQQQRQKLHKLMQVPLVKGTASCYHNEHTKFFMCPFWLVKFIYTVKNASEVHEKSSKQCR